MDRRARRPARLAWARDRLRDAAAVVPDNSTGAMALYEKEGMRVVRGFDVYDKPVA